MPRFLLKGFTSRTEKQNYFGWVFQREAVPFEANIDKIAVSKKFYTNKELDADQEITEAETELSEFVNSLRRISCSTQLDLGLLPELITHLEIRTRNLRESFLSASNLLLNEIIHLINEKETFKQIVLNKINREPNLLYDKINKLPLVDKLPTAFRKLFINIVLIKSQQYLKSQQFSKEMDKGLSIIAEILASEASVHLPQAIKNGHIEGLKRSLFPDVRVNRYRDLKFRIVVLKEGLFILGDSAVIIETESGTKYKPHLEVDDKIKNIYLPISKYQLIVGQKDDDICPTNIEKILTSTAECSREFFVSPDNTPKKENFAKSIGKNAQMLSKREASIIVSKWIEKELTRK